ncbi:MAG: HD domain-containing phosphohydrolase [Pseudomonadota bacterium]
MGDIGAELDQVLIVDDEDAVCRLLKRILQKGGYSCATASNAKEAREVLAGSTFQLMLCDINMPGESGLSLVEKVRADHPDIAVIMVTAVEDHRVAQHAINLGVYGYLIKPFEINEILINVASAMRRRELEINARQYQASLVSEVDARTQELHEAMDRLKIVLSKLESASLDTIIRLSLAAEYKDEDTGSHILRMSNYAAALARKLDLGEKVVQWVLYASPMHDVGKIGIPDKILLKPGPLDPDEWNLMKQHTTIGAKILSGGDFGFLRLAEVIAHTHHEKWDGAGYPRGLKGKEIPLVGQIVSMADVFDALTSERPYKKAFSLEKSYRIIRESAGSQFRPDLVEAFFDIRLELEEIKEKYSEPAT